MRTLRIPVTVRNVSHLVPTVGTATTPDPATMPNDCTFVYKVRGPSGALQHAVAAQYDPDGQRSWLLLRRTDTFSQFTVTATGLAGGAVNRFLGGQAAPSGGDDLKATAITFDNGSGRFLMRGWTYSDGWSAVGVASDVGAAVTPFNSTAVVRIGDFTVGGLPFGGRIYYVELRTGLDPAAGTVLWRFDAADYPGTGTSYVDPRGNTWTLTSASAIVTAPTATFVYPVARSVVRVP